MHSTCSLSFDSRLGGAMTSEYPSITHTLVVDAVAEGDLRSLCPMPSASPWRWCMSYTFKRAGLDGGHTWCSAMLGQETAQRSLCGEDRACLMVGTWQESSQTPTKIGSAWPKTSATKLFISVPFPLFRNRARWVSRWMCHFRHRSWAFCRRIGHQDLAIHRSSKPEAFKHRCTSSTAQGGGGSFKNRKPIGEIGCCESRMAERIHWWTERWLELCFLEWLQCRVPVVRIDSHRFENNFMNHEAVRSGSVLLRFVSRPVHGFIWFHSVRFLSGIDCVIAFYKGN